MNFKYAMMTYTMARQMPDRVDMARICKITRELGLTAMDQVTLYDYDAADVRRIADDHGIKIVSYTFSADLNFPDSDARKAGRELILRELEKAAILGAPVMMIPVGGKAEYTREQSRSHWIAGLNEVMPKVRASGIKLTVEHFPQFQSPFILSDDMEEAIKAVPGFHVTFDSGNMLTGGEDPCHAFLRHKDNILHAHFKDWMVGGDQGLLGLDGRHYQPALIGEGVVPYRRLLKVMKDCAYDGYIDIEYEGNDYPAAEAVKKALAYLQNLEAELA